MSTVFFVHQPVRWDSRDRKMIAADLRPAEHYGKVVIMIPGLDRPPCAIDALPTIRATLAYFKATDYLALAGDLDLVLWAGMLAYRRVGDGLRLLKYHSRNREYEVKEAPPGLFD